MKNTLFFSLLSVAFCYAAISCTTSSGGLYEKTSSADKSVSYTASPVNRITTDEKEDEAALTITSVPENADIFIDNRYYGRTPLTVKGLEKGTYRIRLEHQYYEPYESYFSYDGKSVTYHVELVRLTGFLVVTTEPENAEVIIGGEDIRKDRVRVPVGTYEIVVRLFGYEEHSELVTIRQEQVTSVNVVLVEAAFNASELSFSRTRFNPENTGLLGKTEIYCYVTAPGEGRLTVSDSAGIEVFSHAFPTFTTWRQSVLWDGRGENGIAYPDGVYTVVLEFVSAKGAEVVTRRGTVSIDRSAVITYATIFSGNAGMLFCPYPMVLPESIFQLTTLFTAHGEQIGDEFAVRAPSDLFVRYGISDELELNVMLGIIPSSTASYPFFASASLKWLFMDTGGFFNAKAATYLRATYHYGTGADSFSNVTGAGLGFPLSAGIGGFSVIVTPEVVIAPWKVTYTSDYDAITGFFSWLYLRYGMVLDAGGGFSIAVSSVVRTIPFDEGFAIDTPLVAGAEIHYLVPDTQFFVSGLATVEFASLSEYFVSGGIGLGFVF